MKSLVWLSEAVLQDSGTRCGADPTSDIATVRRRSEHEGTSFLTITLPSFATAFDQALDRGRLVPSDTPSFAWHRRGLPEFLRGFLLQVFGRDGRLLPDPSVEAISCIRQVCLLHKKTLLECTEKRTRKAERLFKETDDEVKAQRIADGDRRLFCAVSRVVWGELLSGLPFGDPWDELSPAHGPGATRERIQGNAKFRFRRWHKRLEEYFPFTEFAIGSLRTWDPLDLDPVDFIEPEDEEPVRVTFVPKTLKTPRVIAIEPVCMQYAQQALLRMLVPRIERGRYTGGRVNFSDQTINNRKALSSSRDRRFATIDLSEASDRVSSSLVWDMLDVAPVFRDYVFACRSRRAELPSGEVITLGKFASMGSALCFPMEAMVFFIAVVSKRLQRANLRPTSRNVLMASRDVYVYGDDILVPTDEAPAACDALGSFGLKVNQHKSFWTGRFRESCGMDAYDGNDVTPTYIRHLQPTRRQDSEAIISWVSAANQLYAKGYWGTVRVIRQLVERVVGQIPHLRRGSSGLHWENYSNVSQYRRWNKDLMRLECLTLVPRPVRRKDPLDGDSALLKCFRVIGCEAVDTTHLQSSVVRGRLALNRRWVPA